MGMGVLRCAMLAAGVDEKLIYKKFVSNDDLFVTELQSRKIAEKLSAWLTGRKLRLNLAEKREESRHMYQMVAALSQERREKRLMRRLMGSGPAFFEIDPQTRKFTRSFVAFCELSGGFWVD